MKAGLAISTWYLVWKANFHVQRDLPERRFSLLENKDESLFSLSGQGK